jgi:hypothetical protein
MKTKTPTSEFGFETRDKKKDYSVPGWVVSWFDNVKLDPERAQKFNDMRVRLCASLGQDNEACDPNKLWVKALDLLLAYESALLSEVDKL